ncbi:hypothetical protein DPMN_007692 [Dreissena polymorpha]|uniref:Uncharacterized protein n=1 Tax=Dreissena polymorpha TaxID=45954 RepID=A0A9D4RYG9_DREPO|nr:hypothetical protein DPMN_007692 [Dreissena polymorpha]
MFRSLYPCVHKDTHRCGGFRCFIGGPRRGPDASGPDVRVNNAKSHTFWIPSYASYPLLRVILAYRIICYTSPRQLRRNHGGFALRCIIVHKVIFFH